MARYRIVTGILESEQDDVGNISRHLKNIALKEKQKGQTLAQRIQALENRISRLEKLISPMRETGRAIFDDVTEVKDFGDLTQKGNKDNII